MAQTGNEKRTHSTGAWWKLLLALFTVMALVGSAGAARAGGATASPRVTSVGMSSQNVAVVQSPSGSNGGTFATSGFLNGYAPTFTNVTLNAIETAPANPLVGFDTMVWVQINNIGTYLADPTFKGRVDSFISGGGKLIVWDSEMTGTDYSNFVYPFTSNSPGAMGASGSTLTIAEQNTLSTSDPTSPYFVDVNAVEGYDAVGDANVMTTFDPAWYVDMTATNTNNVTGPVQAYARYGSGLVIWNGLDMDPLTSSTGFDPTSTDPAVQENRIWMLDLMQTFHPDNLPGQVKVFGVAVTPHAQQVALGHPATVTATVSSASVPQAGVTVTFTVTAGPDTGKTGQAITDAAGQAIWSWAGASSGTDTIEASAMLLDTHDNFVTVTDTATVAWGGQGGAYVMAAADGGVFCYGGAGFYGSMAPQHLASPVVGDVRTPSGNGYWLVAADGGVFAFGDAAFLGSMGGHHLNSPVVGIARTASGDGYWLVAADGGVFAFGNAAFHGSEGGKDLRSPIVDITQTPSGNGYWMVAGDGGIFAFGDAGFFGSAANLRLHSPIAGQVPTADGNGYWLVGADGGVFAYGDAPYLGRVQENGLVDPVVSIDNSQNELGYVIATADGGVFAFGDASYLGGMSGNWLNGPMVHVATS
jgi:hypothetical protein